jgi:hypothetical protein
MAEIRYWRTLRVRSAQALDLRLERLDLRAVADQTAAVRTAATKGGGDERCSASSSGLRGAAVPPWYGQ